MIVIEPAVMEDIPQLAAILSTLFGQEADFHPDPTRQERGLRLIIGAPEAGRIFVARRGDKILGMVNLLFTVSTARGDPVILLEDMFVREEVRGLGIGAALLERAIDFAKTGGFSRITLLTDAVNEKAIRFYARHGFDLSAMAPMRLLLG
jgi:GNAT superfamily N-acetyltransferase